MHNNMNRSTWSAARRKTVIPFPMEVATHNRQGVHLFVGEAGDSPLPQAHPRAIASTSVGGDQELGGRRIDALAHPQPPMANRLDGELRRVVRDADADPPLVASNVVDTVRDDLAQRGIGEIMHVDFNRFALLLPLFPR